MESILIVEDTDSLREVLSTVLAAEGYKVTSASSAEEGLSLFEGEEFTLVLSDLKLPNRSGLEFLQESRRIDNSVPVVVMTAYGNIEIAVKAMKLGATDFITKPFDPEMLCNVIAQVAQHRRIIDRNWSKSKRRIITQNQKMEEVLSQARKVAALNTPVMILGESGSGKELIARYIHEQSPRQAEKFVAVNCGSMPEELLESEFFGHEPGAFTGAKEQRLGLFEVASDGSIFLDEIGNMPWQLQVKLLRTLQESEVKRLGSNAIRKVNTRVISATNCDLDLEIKNGSFREDLFYRLGVFILEIPPLRERPEDIELLAKYFIECYSEVSNQEVTLSDSALKLLQQQRWPGNVRQLENALERALIFSDGVLTKDSFDLNENTELAEGNDAENKSLPELASAALRTAEISAISQTLQQTRGNKSKAAKLLGVSYKTLLNKIKDYEIFYSP
jgi:DNA-binding NtrC family response regulator